MQGAGGVDDPGFMAVAVAVMGWVRDWDMAWVWVWVIRRPALDRRDRGMPEWRPAGGRPL